MTLRRAVAIGALCLSLIAAGGADANAAEPGSKGIEGVFELQGTNGYRLFGLMGSTGEAGELLMVVSKKGEDADYVAHGEVTEEAVHFDLGSLGEIDLTVRPTGLMETVHPSCGKPVTLEGEEYVGTFEFHGEEGFTEAAATSTPMRVKPLLSIVCGVIASEAESGGTLPGAELQIERPGGPKLQLDQNRRGARVFYEASISEKEGALRVHRAVRGHFPGSAMTYDSSLATAHFSGASPFSGSAIYKGKSEAHETRPGKGTWRGNLKVDFPGRAAVPLAGPSFSATIVAHRHRGSQG